MSDQLTDRARKEAEEIIQNIIRRPSWFWRGDIYEIIERHMREASQENNIHPNDFEPMAFASWRNDNY